MRVYRYADTLDVMLCAEAPDGAMCMELGWMTNMDDKITIIRYPDKRYCTLNKGWHDFPEKWYRCNDLEWQVHRIGARTVAGHEHHD